MTRRVAPNSAGIASEHHSQNPLAKIAAKLSAIVSRCFFLILFLVAACLNGLASASPPDARYHVAGVDTNEMSWAQALAPSATQDKQASGIQLLAQGHDAFAARLALADSAEHSLDVQYYIWRPDRSGKLIAERMLRAADRGVHVRMLLDDVGGSASDEILLAMGSHTNLEVRLFNPVSNRFFRKLSLLFDFERFNRRMHNKSFTADRLVTIVGGRNIADQYFATGNERLFADLDVLAAGPAARDVSEMFDRYWESSSSIPIHTLAKKTVREEPSTQTYSQLAMEVAAITHSTEFAYLAGNEVAAEIRRYEPALVWGSTRLVADLPEKVTTDPEDTSTHLLPGLRPVVDGTQHEVFIVSPYFVPGKKGMDFFYALRARGIRVVVISNSLAANDVVAVHAGYRRYRKALVRAGVELWEIKPDIQIRTTSRAAKAGTQKSDKPPRSALHAKTFVFDRETLFVGSLNLDPRSASINTEMGLLVAVPQLARPAVDSFEKTLVQDAYRLEYIPGPGPCKECGKIIWVSQENGREVRYTHEPNASFGRRLQVCLLSLLPMESQL